MIYETFTPCVDLGPFVKCYWTLDSENKQSNTIQTIVPDGCMEMIFHCGDLYRQYTIKGASFIQPRSFVIGQLTKPLKIEPTGCTNIFSVRFNPNGFFPLTTVPLKSIENNPIALDALFGSKGDSITQEILKAKNTIHRIALIESFLLELRPSEMFIHNAVKSAVDLILSSKGQAQVNHITVQSKTSPRHLERMFSKAIGLSPKKLSKTIRLVNTLHVMLANQHKSLTALAYENDYYDQSHFIKEFKELTGYTPSAFFGKSLEMSSLFYAQNN